MARGTAFSELISRVRSETGRSDNLAVGFADLPMIGQTINSNYQTLYNGHDWTHLKRFFDRIPLNAGQRYYDIPTGLNSERIIEVRVWRDGKPQPLDRGIGFDEYNAYSPEDDERSEPALRWDIKWTGSVDQLEFWPLPSTNDQDVQIHGFQAAPRLVSDDDPCLLDDDLVVGFAAAEILGEKDGKVKLSKAQDHLRSLKARPAVTQRGYQMGLGGYGGQERPKLVLRIGHTS